MTLGEGISENYHGDATDKGLALPDRERAALVNTKLNELLDAIDIPVTEDRERVKERFIPIIVQAMRLRDKETSQEASR